MSEFIVDLDAFARNLATIREKVAPAQHMLVVKDDAYSHGLAPIVERAVAEGVTWIGALDVATGRQVRDIAGSDVRIFAWMLQGPADIADAVAADLDCGIGNAALLEEVALTAAEHPVRVHLKIDTGLHRNGVRPEQWPAFVARASELEAAGKVTVAGIWSHIAEASDAEDDESRAVFDRAVADARAVGLDPEHLHLAASAAAFARPEFRYTMTRIGAFAYGIRSTDGPSDDELGITPIGTLTATVTAAHAAEAGAEVPESEDQEPFATIDVGFGALSSLYRGKLRISHAGELSEIAHVSVSDSVIRPTTAQPGDTVAVFGGSAADSATDLAERIGTIGEEVILRISPLIPRRYTP